MSMLLSFFAFHVAIAALTWVLSRRGDAREFFLGRRSLSAPLVALSVLMTNFSTEQLIGLNGDAYRNGAVAIAWEAFGAVGIVVFAWIFLPRYYAAGVTTIPEYVERRCGSAVRRLMAAIMLLSLVLIGIPFVLYSGSLAMVTLFDLPQVLGLPSREALWLTALLLGGTGLAYAQVGGMRGLAHSDLFYAVIFVGAAFLMPFLGLRALGEGDLAEGFGRLVAARPAAFDPFGGVVQGVPPSALLTGMLVINIGAWCANQGSAQKAFAAASLAEGQKGMLLAAAVKLIAPVFFVLPGMIAWVMFSGGLAHGDTAYVRLVRALLPESLVGFFAAAIAGATITSVSGLTHSATTLLAIDISSRTKSPEGVRLGRARWVSVGAVALAVAVAPIIAQQQTGFYVLMKRLNAAATIPVVAVVVMAVLARREWTGRVVACAMLMGSALYLAGDLTLRTLGDVAGAHWLHLVGLSFAAVVGVLRVSGRPLSDPPAESSVALPRWPHERAARWAVLAAVVALYGLLWQFAHSTRA